MLRGSIFALTGLGRGRNYTAAMGLRGAMLGMALSCTMFACDPVPPTPHCVVGADCASGICLSDRTCAPPHESDAGGVDAYVPPGVDGGTPDAGMSGRCLPNEDGVVSRLEAPFGPDLSARYAVAADVSVSTVGRTDATGRHWDYAPALPGDHDFDVATEPLTGRWFVDRYPGASYVARLRDTTDLLGVFRITASALELLGVVSPSDGIGRTELTYDPPVRVLTFPLELGNRWTTDTRVTGYAEGLVAAFAEVYESEVDGRGSVGTPYASFDALRVRVTLTQQLTPFVSRVTRQFLFVAECFGTVAMVVSQQDETEIEFTRAAEVRRLGF